MARQRYPLNAWRRMTCFRLCAQLDASVGATVFFRTECASVFPSPQPSPEGRGGRSAYLAIAESAGEFGRTLSLKTVPSPSGRGLG